MAQFVQVMLKLINARLWMILNEASRVEDDRVTKAFPMAKLIKLVVSFYNVVRHGLPYEYLFWILQRHNTSPVLILEGYR